jgi:hypothetical protein
LTFSERKKWFGYLATAASYGRWTFPQFEKSLGEHRRKFNLKEDGKNLQREKTKLKKKELG